MSPPCDLRDSDLSALIERIVKARFLGEDRDFRKVVGYEVACAILIGKRALIARNIDLYKQDMVLMPHEYPAQAANDEGPHP
jgi:hypothetical protein